MQLSQHAGIRWQSEGQHFDKHNTRPPGTSEHARASDSFDALRRVARGPEPLDERVLHHAPSRGAALLVGWSGSVWSSGLA